MWQIKLTHIYWATSDIQDKFFSMKYVKNTDVEIDITSYSHITSWQSQFQKNRISKTGKTPYNTTVRGLRGHIFVSLILKALVWISIGSETMWQPYCPLGGQYIPHGGCLLSHCAIIYYLDEMRIKDMSTTESPTFSDFFYLYIYSDKILMVFRWTCFFNWFFYWEYLALVIDRNLCKDARKCVVDEAGNLL